MHLEDHIAASQIMHIVTVNVRLAFWVLCIIDNN